MAPIAERRRRIAFERRTELNDGMGNTVSGPWTTQFTLWARVQPRLGSEAVIAARLEGRKPVTIKVYSTDRTRTITTDWRARDERTGEIYAIRWIGNPDERDRYLEILAEAGVAA